MDPLMAGEMSPDELDQSLPLRRDNPNDRTQNSGELDPNQQSAPRTFDRMIKSNLPSYSPLTVSRQKGGTTEGDNQTVEGRNTLSVSMSDNSSSAFNAHSPPYMRREMTGKGSNLDMEDIYDNVGRKSATEYRTGGVDQNQSQEQYGARQDMLGVLSVDSSSQLQISQDSILRQSQQQRMIMQQMRDIQSINNRVQESQHEEDDDDDDSFSAPMIDASYLRGSSNNGGVLTQSGMSQFQNEPVIKDSVSPVSAGDGHRRSGRHNDQVLPQHEQKSHMLRQMAYDGFIGGNGDENDSDYNDLSGELISIEDTYKEVSLYKKSGASNDGMRASGGANGANSAAQLASQNMNGQTTYEELKQSQQISDGMKRSMTVIQEEDFEESALATSNLNFNSHLGGHNIPNSSPRSRKKHSNQNLSQSHLSKSGPQNYKANNIYSSFGSEVQQQMIPGAQGNSFTQVNSAENTLGSVYLDKSHPGSNQIPQQHSSGLQTMASQHLNNSSSGLPQNSTMREVRHQLADDFRAANSMFQPQQPINDSNPYALNSSKDGANQSTEKQNNSSQSGIQFKRTSAFSNQVYQNKTEETLSPSRVLNAHNITTKKEQNSSQSRKRLRTSIDSGKSPASRGSSSRRKSKGKGRKSASRKNDDPYLDQSQEKQFSIQDMLNKHQQRYSEQYKDALQSSQISSNTSPYRQGRNSVSPSTVHFRQSKNIDQNQTSNLQISQSTANMLQQMNQSDEQRNTGNLNNTSSFTHSQEFANRKLQVKAQVEMFKHSMEMLKKTPLNNSSRQSQLNRGRSTSGSNERNRIPKHQASEESDLAASRFVDRTMGLSPPRSTTMLLQSPDNSKINIQGRYSGGPSAVHEHLQSQFPALMHAVDNQPSALEPRSNPDTVRAASKQHDTEAKQSLLSMDDLTLSATDGTALKQPSKIQNAYNALQQQHQSSIGQLLQGSLLTNEQFTNTAQSKDHLDEVKRLFTMMQQLQVDLQQTESQRNRAYDDLEEAKRQHAIDLNQTEDLYQGKLRAKEYEIQVLKEGLNDREAIAGEKIADIRNKLSNAERSISMRVEQEYAAILDKKEQQLKFHDQSRQEAQTKLLQFESDWQLEKRKLVTEYEARLVYDRDQAIEEINELRAKVNQSNEAEKRKIREILSQEYEFKANQREGFLKQQIQSLEQQIDLEREVIEKTKENEFESRLLQQRVQMQEQQVVDNAQTTNDIYQEMEKVLRQKFQAEERLKIKKLKHEFAAEYKQELAKKESHYEGLIAKERQQVSKANMKLAQADLKMETLESQVEAERTDKENLQKQQNELDLKPVKGSQGHCLRCEALMISNGAALQKIKKLKKDNQTMAKRLQQ